MTTRNNDIVILAKRLRQLRKEKNITQSELGERLGVKRSCVANWESGARVPDIRTVTVMAKLFGVSIDYLYGRTDKRYNVKMPKDRELDLTKLNANGLEFIFSLYEYALGKEEYTKE